MLKVVYNDPKHGTNGEIILDLREFFPTKKTRIRQLYKKFFLIGTEPADYYVDECLKVLDDMINEEGFVHAAAIAKAQESLEWAKEGSYPTQPEAVKKAEARLKKVRQPVTMLEENRELLNELAGRA